ncbi:MAG: STAS domain-containing protein [Solirubrobacterales bacterium]|nr:STAS domain-containing protein [Solirubrobacterales bacterium]
MTGDQPTPFSVETEDRDAQLLVRLRGELDLATAPEVEDIVLPAARDGRHVIVDLRALEFLDSSGVRVLVAAHAAAGEGGGRLSVVRGPAGGPVQRVLEISGLEGVLDLVDDA